MNPALETILDMIHISTYPRDVVTGLSINEQSTSSQSPGNQSSPVVSSRGWSGYRDNPGSRPLTTDHTPVITRDPGSTSPLPLTQREHSY